MKTYCNPLPIENMPEGRWLDAEQTGADPRTITDYRSVSDPSVVYHDGKWILYPSYGMAFVSEDFVHWKHMDVGIPPLHQRYSPAVVHFRGKWYLNTHSRSELYEADAPTGPFTLCGHMTDVNGTVFHPADGCFLADVDAATGEERLYFYWHASKTPGPEDDVEGLTATVGAEMDPEKPWQMKNAPVYINWFDPGREWQRFGEHHQNGRMGWIEGQWMLKRNGRYYLLYAGCGTQYAAYTNGVLYSDEGPLTGFQPQKYHDPFTEKRHGLIRGAGHGCLVEGPNGTLWTFYTNIFCYNHLYERRISMDPVGVDAHGELYCPAATETPQYAPGELAQPELGNGAGWLPLTFMERPQASSAVPGRDGLYASDDSVLTWWQPAPDDEEPTLTYRLDHCTRYAIHSIRLIWRDIGMEVLDGVMPGPFRYVVEYAADAGLSDWRMLVDASENMTDLPVDYRETAGEAAYGLRLRILGWPRGITPGVVSFTAFGTYIREK